MFDRARACAAPSIRNCLLIGEGDVARLVFVAASSGSVDDAMAVTLTRPEIEALAGMLDAYLDSNDPEAVGLF